MVWYTKNFDNKGNVPTTFGNDWLSSVYGKYNDNKDFEFEDGFQVYRTADRLADQFYVSADMQLFSSLVSTFGSKVGTAAFSSVFGDNLVNGATIEKVWGAVKGLSGTGSSAAIYNNVEEGTIKMPWDQITTFGANKLAGILNPSVPNVTFTEGQIALRGKATQDIKIAGFSQRYIDHPGTRGAQVGVLENYPYYNEAPGLFALINKPMFNIKFPKYYEVSTIGLVGIFGDFELQVLDPLKYAINPSSGIDINKSKLKATIEFDFYFPKSYSNAVALSETRKLFPRSHGFYVESKGLQKAKSTAGFGDSVRHLVVQTRIMPLDKIHEVNFKKEFRTASTMLGSYTHLNFWCNGQKLGYFLDHDS